MAAKAAGPRRGAEIQLGDLLRGHKRFAEAATAYGEAIRRLKAADMPPHWSLYYSRGIAYERSGQWNLAEADLEHALELKPDQPLVLNYLGYSWIDRGEKLNRGLKMIEQAVELRPEDGYIVDSLGWAHYRLGDYAECRRISRKGGRAGARGPDDQRPSGRRLLADGPAGRGALSVAAALQFKPDKEDVKPIEAKLGGGSADRGPPSRRRLSRSWRSRSLRLPNSPLPRSTFTCM